ncbi:MAG: hypothetical protein RIC24_14610 [Hyphomicrobiales bacterium]|jgi:hypothetical protein
MRWAFSVLALAWASNVWGGEADVIAATATQDIRGTWTVSATILHGDTGWEHYADRFDVLDEDGTVLGSRTLFHPHVDEQPFTRSLNALTIPDAVTTITVRAHDSVDELGGATVEIILER